MACLGKQRKIMMCLLVLISCASAASGWSKSPIICRETERYNDTSDLKVSLELKLDASRRLTSYIYSEDTEPGACTYAGDSADKKSWKHVGKEKIVVTEEVDNSDSDSVDLGLASQAVIRQAGKFVYIDFSKENPLRNCGSSYEPRYKHARVNLLTQKCEFY